MSRSRTIHIDHLDLPASLAGRPKLKTMIEEELAAMLESSSMSGSVRTPGAKVELRGPEGDRQTARRIAAQIFAGLT